MAEFVQSAGSEGFPGRIHLAATARPRPRRAAAAARSMVARWSGVLDHPLAEIPADRRYPAAVGGPRRTPGRHRMVEGAPIPLVPPGSRCRSPRPCRDRLPDQRPGNSRRGCSRGLEAEPWRLLVRDPSRIERRTPLAAIRYTPGWRSVSVGLDARPEPAQFASHGARTLRSPRDVR